MAEKANMTLPKWGDIHTQKRVKETQKRKKMLDGEWMKILEMEISEHISEDRQLQWGKPDLTSNIFKVSAKGLSALYHEAPTIENDNERQAEGLIGELGLIDKGGLWPMMVRGQYYTIGLRECFVAIAINDAGNGFVYRLVTPDNICASSSAGNPMQPNILKELRLRTNEETKESEWTIDYYDITDPKNPKYKVFGLRKNPDDPTGLVSMDITNANLYNACSIYLSTETNLQGDFSGDKYPYRSREGVPFIPYTLYHAQITGKLFDSFFDAELVEGTLRSGVYYTFYGHGVKNACFPQRWAANAELVGATTKRNPNVKDGKNRSVTVDADPTGIMQFISSNPDLNIPPQFGQWLAGVDLDVLLTANIKYARNLTMFTDLAASEIQRESGDPKSGYALQINNEAKRAAQKTYAPHFRMGDIETIQKSAMIANRMLGTNFPEDGYDISYKAIPLSPEEMRAIREEIKFELEAKLITRKDAIRRMNPHLSNKKIEDKLREIDQENRLFQNQNQNQ